MNHDNRNIRILVVEDDESIRATLVDILDLNGYSVCQAGDGCAGLETAKREVPDLILTDIAMPGLDGFQMIRALDEDERTRAIPIIIVSASVELERVRRGMNLGASDYIVKPFTEDQVLGSIQARLEKKALLDELDAFAHTVAHDLKNPIALVSGRAELLQIIWKESSEEEKLKQVQEIINNARRLAGIVDELLILSGIRKQPVHPKPISMAEIVKEGLARVENIIGETGAKVELPSSWPVALGYAPWVTEIWANYLSNAVKYGGKPPIITLGADQMPSRNCIRFWVQDNGPGMSEEDKGKLFLQFSRVSTSVRAKGHGLGLSIVHRIAEKLNGAVGADSTLGAGSRFWFELPAAPEEHA